MLDGMQKIDGGVRSRTELVSRNKLPQYVLERECGEKLGAAWACLMTPYQYQMQYLEDRS